MKKARKDYKLKDDKPLHFNPKVDELDVKQLNIDTIETTIRNIGYLEHATSGVFEFCTIDKLEEKVVVEFILKLRRPLKIVDAHQGEMMVTVDSLHCTKCPFEKKPTIFKLSYTIFKPYEMKVKTVS